MPIKLEEVAYRDGETPLTGVLVDDADAGKRPGILLVHGGGGLDVRARGEAQRYAGLGYTVFACDMFGAGVAGDRERVLAVVTRLRNDPDTLVRRAQAGLSVLSSQRSVNGRFGAVGFCFGGMTVITLARSGADYRGVVSMHGSFKTSRPAQPGVVTASVLACHGALDPHVPMADVAALIDEFDAAAVDYQVIVYGGAMHGFTHANAVPGAIPGVEYNALADQRSFAAATAFFAEVLG
ncbi:MAG: dienelactone hydrolase family protein [Candidatus Dormibacteria bacterium]